MITPDYVRYLAKYNAEMNRRFYGAAATLTEAQRREECGAFFGSIQRTLSHLIWGDRMWMSRFAGWPKPEVGISGSVTLYENFEAMRADRVRQDAEIEAWAAGVDAGWLAGELRWYSGAMQREMVMPTAPLVVHMFNHQTHHRGQVHAMLTRFGAKTGDTDLPFVI